MPDSRPSAYTSETIELLSKRVSVRSYKPDPVPEAMVEAILKAAFRAPTSSNIQSYSVIVVRDREVLRRLAAITSNQKHVAEAPVFLAFCADLTRIAFALERRGHSIADNNMETGLVSSIDAALVGMSASLAAESLGLQGVMIGAVRNDATASAKILDLPDRVYCVFGMCLGWPAEAPAQKPRMDYASMVHYERYGAQRGASGMAAHLAAYDAALAKHYRATGRATTDDSWTHDMDKKFHPWLRDKLRQQLKERGFDFR
ncbi:MAG: NADPH-dependent oxidoreductase [Alphaproteobacteria bacterium]|nr:NADPH-dependent oxidoreductase [Alphaproteobacteria bacterium]